MANMRIRGTIENTRMLSLDQAGQYVGMGRNTFRKWADQIGATRKFGSRVMFDKVVIDKALDAMAAGAEQGTPCQNTSLF